VQSLHVVVHRIDLSGTEPRGWLPNSGHSSQVAVPLWSAYPSLHDLGKLLPCRWAERGAARTRCRKALAFPYKINGASDPPRLLERLPWVAQDRGYLPAKHETFATDMIGTFQADSFRRLTGLDWNRVVPCSSLGCPDRAPP